MNILVPDSWLREYLDTNANPTQIKDCLSLCGPSVEKVVKQGNDYIYHIEITSNRVDMASILGFAGEAMAILPRFGIKARFRENITLVWRDISIKPKKEFPLHVTISNPNLCPRFAAIILENIKMGDSPAIIRDRLTKSGIRPLSNVVDVSNYLMRLFGQPVHTFDYDKIKHAVMIMRESKKGEKIATLDGKTFTLPGGDIIVEDGDGRLIDLCGIMGGENSCVSAETKRVLLFVQTYDPIHIRRTSMVLSQRTEASSLFEKSLDLENVLPTLIYGIKLLQKWAGAIPASKIIDIYPHPHQPKKIAVSTDFITSRLGVHISAAEIKSIINSLGFTVLPDPSDRVLEIMIPSRRTNDISIPEDIVEEVARIYGYHNLPSKLMAGDIPITDKPKNLPIEEKAKQILKYWGYTEIYNYSFISKDLIDKSGLSPGFHLRLANPLTQDFEYMRISLIPSMLETVAKNQNIRQKISFFEEAKVYLLQRGNLPHECTHLVIAENSDFYKLKGFVEALLKELGVTEIKANSGEKANIYYHPQQQIVLSIGEKVLATVGRVHPNLATNFAIKDDFYLAEINMENIILLSNPIKQFTPIPLYPAVSQDLTFATIDKFTVGAVLSDLYRIDPIVANVELLDRYKNSLTLRLSFQHLKRNLTNEDVKKVREKILSHLDEKFHLSLKS